MTKHNTNDTPPHLMYQTQYSRTGQLNMINKKPFRTEAQKVEAKRLARKDSDGTYRSTGEVSYHSRAADTNK